MGEASSVKVSDIEKFASCNLGNTFKVWSLVYTWRYSLDQDECIGFVVQQWLGKSSGSRRVWSCPQEMGQCEGEPSPSWAVLIAKEHSGPSLCPCLSKGSLILLGWASGEPVEECGWAQPNPAQGGIQNLNLQNKQANKRYFLLLCNKNPDSCIPSPAPTPCWLCLSLRTFPVFPWTTFRPTTLKGWKLTMQFTLP